MKKIFFNIALFLVIGLTAFNVNQEPEQPSFNQQQNQTNINAFISLFEIPATDINRAINFYEAVLGVSIEKMEIPGVEMGVFPYENQLVTGVIMQGEDFTPCADGVTIYLNAGDNLQPMLDKVENNGGKILVPKTAHADDSGYFALFIDSEGNKLGLNSPN